MFEVVLALDFGLKSPVEVVIGRVLWRVASLLPEERSHLMMFPSFPEVKRYFPDSDARAEVTEKRWPRVRRMGGDARLYYKGQCDMSGDEFHVW